MTKMRPFTRTIPLEEARAIIDAAVQPIDRTEHVRLLDANGRVLAGGVTAAADVPPFSRAAITRSSPTLLGRSWLSIILTRAASETVIGSP